MEVLKYLRSKTIWFSIGLALAAVATFFLVSKVPAEVAATALAGISAVVAWLRKKTTKPLGGTPDSDNVHGHDILGEIKRLAQMFGDIAMDWDEMRAKLATAQDEATTLKAANASLLAENMALKSAPIPADIEAATNTLISTLAP